jgi:pimeloyl-ACP methyl ester carboxylesterase
MSISSPRALLVAIVCGVTASCNSLPPAHTSLVGSYQVVWAHNGSAQTTVVFQSGLGDGMSPWAAVLDRLPLTVSAFTYDRPGYGASRPAPTTSRSPCEVARELHDVLAAAGKKPPYLLVGHSLGGQFQYAYSRLFPDEVIGMLLLDPTHPDHWTSLQRETPVSAAMISALRATVFSPAMRAEFDGQSSCLDSAPPLTKQIPTRILVSTRFEVSEPPAFRSVVARLRTDWLTKLPGARLNPVDGAGHYIQKDKPEIVAAEIRSMLVERPAPAP